jgi:hypothetical protein
MALNPNYEQIGKTFVQQYYVLMDDSTQRPNVANFYLVFIFILLITSSANQLLFVLIKNYLIKVLINL